MNQSRPLVSVIIPCYRQAHFLGEAIESVLNQTYPNREIIVVDDGSPDNTADVAGRYSAVRLIRQENQGVSAARNTGIKESRGEYLVFLDADDRLRTEALEAGVSCMAEHPESMLVYGRFHCMREDGTPSPLPSDFFDGDNLYLRLLTSNCIGMVAPVMYRRVIFDEVGGFDSSVNRAEDYDMYLRIARLHPTHTHPKTIADYRVYETSASNDYALMLRAVLVTLRRQWKYVKGKKEYEKAFRAGLNFWREYYGEPLYIYTARRLWDVRQLRRNICDLWFLLRYYPQVISVHGSSRISKFVARLKNTQINNSQDGGS